MPVEVPQQQKEPPPIGRKGTRKSNTWRRYWRAGNIYYDHQGFNQCEKTWLFFSTFFFNKFCCQGNWGWHYLFDNKNLYAYLIRIRHTIVYNISIFSELSRSTFCMNISTKMRHFFRCTYIRTDIGFAYSGVVFTDLLVIIIGVIGAGDVLNIFR